MKRLILLMLLLSLSPMQKLFAEVADCDRPTPDDMIEYKESYLPVEYAPEAFSMEIADITVLILLLLIGAFASLRKRSARTMTALVLTGLIYFGFIRGGCICPVGAITNIAIGLRAPELIGKLVALIFLIPLIFAFLAGRIFCSTACPIGAVQHLISRKRSVNLPIWISSILRLLPIGVLFMTVWCIFRIGLFLACKLDVYRVIFFSGYAWTGQLLNLIGGTLTETRILFAGDLLAWSILGTVLLLGLLVARPFCRFVCPYGVLLGIFSGLGIRKRRIDVEHCTKCKRCITRCPVQAISQNKENREIKISNVHCIQCGRCDEICKGGFISG